MTDASPPSSLPELVIRAEADAASTCVEVRLKERSISHLWLIPFTLHIGAARVRMDGIGGVGTERKHRNQGHSRRVLEAALEHMKQGDAALSMLYGIPDFYTKFGFATAGPDHLVFLTDLQGDSTLPVGWTIRPFVAADLPAVQALYSRNMAESTGAALRPTVGGVWSQLLKTVVDGSKDACRVVNGPDGDVHAYLWRANRCWYVEHKLESDYKDALVLGEVMADGPVSADAALAACRLWAGEEAATRKVKQVVLAFPPTGPLAAAAMRQDARFLRLYSACGDSMARVVNVTRLFQALQPELQARWKAAQQTWTGTLIFHTDIGSVSLHITPEEITVDRGSGFGVRGSHTTYQDLQVHLPQSELARLALGAFPPDDLLARLPAPPTDAAVDLLKILFPFRHPHMYLPDRY